MGGSTFVHFRRVDIVSRSDGMVRRPVDMTDGDLTKPVFCGTIYYRGVY